MDEIWQLTGGLLAALAAVMAVELAALRCRRIGDWLRGRKATENGRHAARPAARHAAGPPLCPICGGFPVRTADLAVGLTDGVLHLEVFSAPCLCGCDQVRNYRCCPVCCGAGVVPRALVRDYLARGEPALWEFRRVGRSN